MKKILLALLLVVVFNVGRAQIQTPRQLFPGLFESVQLSDIFPDNKTFVDATPRSPVRRGNKPGYSPAESHQISTPDYC